SLFEHGTFTRRQLSGFPGVAAPGHPPGAAFPVPGGEAGPAPPEPDAARRGRLGPRSPLPAAAPAAPPAGPLQPAPGPGAGRDQLAPRAPFHAAVPDEPRARPMERDGGPGDGGGARAAVGQDDVAIDGNGMLPQRLEVDRGPERTADEPLDLEGPAADAPAFPGRPGRCRAGEHGVF